MRKKSLWLTFLLFGIFVSTFAQYDEDVPLPKSLRPYQSREKNNNRYITLAAGGSVGAQFGTYNALSISPFFGVYPKIKWLLLGVSATYMFSYDSYYKYAMHVFGGGIFAEGLIWKQRIIVHAGYEYVNYGNPYLDPNNPNKILTERIESHGVMIGPGYRQKLTEIFSVYGLMLFNVIPNENTFYSNPTFRIGFVADF
ncbi:MAG: hypothetical protein LBR51_05030 [Bacteroidales bacterium]|jgi:hypothetical protein|nr:hypothetical protein [Bacteroidales bacterium]